MTGSPRKLAWSNTGGVAKISEDGVKISLHSSLHNRKTGTYELSRQSKHSIDAPEGRHFVHIQFSGIGTEIAAIDGHGGLHVYSIAGAIGRMPPSLLDPATANNEKSDLDMVVGMHWLPLWPMEFKVSLRLHSSVTNHTC